MSTSATSDDLTRGEIEDLARWLRARSIRMAERAGSGHPTSSMSAADLIACLAARHLKLAPEQPDLAGNDRLLFSKGHASPLLYALLEAMGVLDGRLGEFRDIVDAYRQLDSILEGHPTPRVPGVAAATGSLGLGLAIGAGFALADHLHGLDDAHVWVLCGDGELAEGSVWEAVEHAASAPIGGLTALVDVNRLGQTGPTRHGWDINAYARRFAAFGWSTIEIDGHDLDAIDQALTTARNSAIPTAIVARTVKGAGASETADQLGKHGKPLDDPDRAIDELGDPHPVSVVPQRPSTLVTDERTRATTTELPSWPVGDRLATRDAFGDAAVAVGRERPQLVALDGDVMDSTRLAEFAKEFPDRFVEAYIAEQLMVSMAIGLHASGWKPLVSTFGAFLTRAHDVLRMATISRSDLTIAGSHAGVSIGEDGPSQMALDDVAMFRAFLGSTVVAPCDANQTASLLDQLVDTPGLSYLRLLRGETPVIYEPGTEFPIGGSVTLGPIDGADAVVIASGVTVHEAIEAADRLAMDGTVVGIIDAYSIKPLDAERVRDAARSSRRIVVVEDHGAQGGLGDAVREALVDAGLQADLIHLAVRDVPASATPAEQRAAARIDASAIVAAIADPPR